MAKFVQISTDIIINVDKIEYITVCVHDQSKAFKNRKAWISIASVEELMPTDFTISELLKFIT